MDFPYMCRYATVHLAILVHVAIIIAHLCGRQHFTTFFPLDGEVPLLCGETTYFGASISMLITIGTCPLFFICGIVAQNCNTCAAGVMASLISHYRPVHLSGEFLLPVCGESLLPIARGVLQSFSVRIPFLSVVWWCQIATYEHSARYLLRRHRQGNN